MASLNLLAISLKPNPHVIAISETWFNDASCTQLNGFTEYIKNRENKKRHTTESVKDRHGGVALFINRDLKSFEVESAVLRSTDAEQIWCGIETGMDKILFGCMYRPPPKQNDSPAARKKLEEAVLSSIVEAKKLVETGKFDGMCMYMRRF
jgi:hypothetical protein